ANVGYGPEEQLPMQQRRKQEGIGAFAPGRILAAILRGVDRDTGLESALEDLLSQPDPPRLWRLIGLELWPQIAARVPDVPLARVDMALGMSVEQVAQEGSAGALCLADQHHRLGHRDQSPAAGRDQRREVLVNGSGRLRPVPLGPFLLLLLLAPAARLFRAALVFLHVAPSGLLQASIVPAFSGPNAFRHSGRLLRRLVVRALTALQLPLEDERLALERLALLAQRPLVDLPRYHPQLVLE